MFGETYEANSIDVTYEWHFVLSNDINEGYIYLKFPPNFYVLDSTPEPTGTIMAGDFEKINEATV